MKDYPNHKCADCGLQFFRDKKAIGYRCPLCESINVQSLFVLWYAIEKANNEPQTQIYDFNTLVYALPRSTGSY